MLILGSPTTVIYGAQIIGFAAQARLPAMYDKREFMIDGGLMGYFPSRLEQARSTAAYVDKILKGAKPNDLPIEQPTRFELVGDVARVRGSASVAVAPISQPTPSSPG